MVRKFLKWCLERGIDLTAISYDHINLFLNELNVSKTTKALYKNTLKRFLGILPDLIQGSELFNIPGKE